MKIRLRVARQVLIKGELTQCLPGDWVDMGRQEAERLINEGKADLPHKPKSGLLPHGCGVVGIGNTYSTLNHLETAYEITTHPTIYNSWSEYDGDIPFLYTCFVHGSVPLRDELLTPGFNLLYVWWAALPWHDPDERLAKDFGSYTERERTVALVHDLRVPVPNPVLVFVKRNSHTKKLMQTFVAEMAEPDSSVSLSLLRALYKTPGLWWPLPYTWGVKDGKDKYER